MKNILNLSFLLLLVNLCQAQQKELALDLEEGKVYRQQIETNSTIRQELEGQNIDMQLSNSSYMSFLVKKINAESFELEVKYEKIEMSIDNLMEFSSETQQEYDVFSSILAEIVNKPFEITMTKKGRILDIRNVNHLLEMVLGKFAEVPEIQFAQYQSQLNSAFGDAAFRSSIELFTAIYPDTPVSRGDKWSISTKLESGMSSLVSSIYELSDQTSLQYIIIGNSNIATDKTADIDAGGMTLNYDLRGTMTSEIKIDKKSGWIIEATINQEMKGISIIKPHEYVPDGMVIPVSIKTETSTKN